MFLVVQADDGAAAAERWLSRRVQADCDGLAIASAFVALIPSPHRATTFLHENEVWVGDPLAHSSTRPSSQYGRVIIEPTHLVLESGRCVGRPVYYARAEAIRVASSSLAFLRSIFRDVALSDDALSCVLAQRPLAPGLTVYRDLNRCPPSTRVEVRRDSIRSALLFASSEVSRAPPTAAALREELEGAITRTLSPYPRRAFALSGGVDSGALVALAFRLGLEGDLGTIAFDAPFGDRAYARALSADLGRPLVSVRPREGAAHFGMFEVDGAPFFWPLGPVEIALFAAMRDRGATAIASGLGGDELLHGAVPLFHLGRSPLRAFAESFVTDVPWMHSWQKPIDLAVKPWLRDRIPQSLLRVRARRATHSAWMGPRALVALRLATDREPFTRLRDLESDAVRYETFATRPSFGLVSDVRHQYEWASGITRLDPYFDAKLVRAVTSWPPASLFLGRESRGLFREAMRGAMPEYVRARRAKATFEPALSELFEHAGGAGLVESLADARELASRDLVVPRAFRKRVDMFLDGNHGGTGAAEWLSVWPALALEGFLRGARPS